MLSIPPMTCMQIQSDVKKANQLKSCFYCAYKGKAQFANLNCIIQQRNYQVSKEIVHGLKFRDKTVMQI